MMEPANYTPPKRTTTEQLAGLGLFAETEPAPAPRSAQRAPSPALHHGNEHSQGLEEKLRVRAGTNNARILAYLRANGESTRKEIAAATGIPINVVTPCVVALRNGGHILELDGKDNRPLRERGNGYLLRAVS
jgi:hypothetical protein